MSELNADGALVRHDADAGRYELVIGDRVVGVAEYHLADTAGGVVATFHHTVVDPAARGRGHAARLVAGALDDVRRRGWRVVATCWYVDRFLTEHPAYVDLRA